MNTKDRFVPTREQWEIAEREAALRFPLPGASTAGAAAYGFFGGGTVASLALILAGLDLQSLDAMRASTLVGFLCGLVGYLFVSAKQKAHGRASAEVIEGYENVWRTEHGTNSSK